MPSANWEIASRVTSGPLEITSLVRHGEYQDSLRSTNANANTAESNSSSDLGLQERTSTVGTNRRQFLISAHKIFDLLVMVLAFAAASAAVLFQTTGITFEEFISMRVKVQNFILFSGLLLTWHLIFLSFGLYQSRRLLPWRVEILDAIKTVVDNVTLAVTVVGTLVVLSGLLILIGAVAMTKFRRVYEAAIFKTLGATRRLIAAVLLFEYGLLGLLAGAIGSGGAVVVDLTPATFIDSSILGVLLDARRRAEETGQTLAVAQGNGNDRPPVVDEHEVPARDGEVVAVLRTVRVVGDAGDAERERQRVGGSPFDLGDGVAGQRVRERRRRRRRTGPGADDVHQPDHVTVARIGVARLAGARTPDFLEEEHVVRLRMLLLRVVGVVGGGQGDAQLPGQPDQGRVDPPLVLQPDVFPAALLGSMRDREITFFPAVPALVRALGAVEWPRPLALRKVICASAPLADADARERRRERERRARDDVEFQQAMATEIRRLFPGCPAQREPVVDMIEVSESTREGCVMANVCATIPPIDVPNNATRSTPRSPSSPDAPTPPARSRPSRSVARNTPCSDPFSRASSALRARVR